MSEGANRNLPARDTLVQPIALYTVPESHNAQRYRQTDGQTEDMMISIADHTVYVRSAKNHEGDIAHHITLPNRHSAAE